MGTRITWKWLAGFTDGDGCIWLPQGKKAHQPSQIHVTWYQTEANAFVLDEIGEFLRSFGIFSKFYLHLGSTNRRSDKPMWHLTVRGCQDVEHVLKKLSPHLIVKYGTAQEALHRLEVLPRGRTYSRKQYCKRGHDQSVAENTYERPSGKKQCRLCIRITERERVRH